MIGLFIVIAVALGIWIWASIDLSIAVGIFDGILAGATALIIVILLSIPISTGNVHSVETGTLGSVTLTTDSNDETIYSFEVDGKILSLNASEVNLVPASGTPEWAKTCKIVPSWWLPWEWPTCEYTLETVLWSNQ